MPFFTRETDPKLDFDHVSPAALMMLEIARGAAGVPFEITSSYRTPEQSVAVGGFNNDAHTENPNSAFDIAYTDHEHRAKIIYGLVVAGFRRIGKNDANGHIHADDSPVLPKPAFWDEPATPGEAKR